MVGICLLIFSLCLTARTKTLIALASGEARSPNPIAQSSPSCKVFPGDEDWPSWAELNVTLGGALLNVNPRFSVCHSSWPDYDATECLFLYENFMNFTLRSSHPTDVMYPYFEGLTCTPSLNSSTPCTLGGYPQYVVNVSNAAQISSAVLFAKDKNIRLVIKNTGHDISGKSTGAGALSIWTHNLKKLQFIEQYERGDYQGPVVKAEAGVQVEEFYQFANDHNVTVVGGECDTVGVAGGYLAGGGHSPIGGLFGLGADSVLEMTVVTADGQEVQVNNDTNPDLYWALRGGGGSTFGVVTSVTVKAYPQIPVTVDKWSWNTITSNVSTEVFWKAMKVYYDNVLAIGAAGCQAMLFPGVIQGTNSTPAGLSMTMYSFFAPNMTPEAYNALTSPMYDGFAQLGIHIDQNVTYHDNYFDGWSRAFPKLDQGTYSSFSVASGSRLIPRANFENESLAQETFDAARRVFEALNSSLVFYAQTQQPNSGMYNSINPAYRSSAAFMIFGAGYTQDMSDEEINSIRLHLTEEAMPVIKAVTPGGGTYVNEADAREPDFGQSFWGSNYERLLRIKKAVDPDNVFYAPLAVGSESWYIDNGGLLPEVQSGRLCRAASE